MRQRTELIEELERQVAQLKQDLEPARKAIERVRELEVVAAQRAHLLNEKDKELAAVREALTERSLRIQELEHNHTLHKLETGYDCADGAAVFENVNHAHNVPNSPLEQLLERYGLTQLARHVKVRRTILEKRHKS